MDCRFKNTVCHFCKKHGHIARAYLTKARQTRGKQTHCLQEETEESVEQNTQGEVYDLYHVAGKNRHPYMVQVAINRAPLLMEVDMGVSMSLISESTYKQLWETPKLRPTSTRLRIYSEQQLTVLGTIGVTVECESQQVTCSLLVIQGGGPSLFGRDWLEEIKLDRKSFTVQHTTATNTQEELLREHKFLFCSELGKSNNITAAFHLKSQATPPFFAMHAQSPMH